MKLLNFKTTSIAITSTMVALFCWCINIPTDPESVSNTTFDVVFKSPTLTMLDASTFIDTLGSRIRVGIATNLSIHIDSASLELVSGDSNTDTTVSFHDFSAMQTVDTAWFYYTLRDTGKITVYANVAVRDWKTLSDTVTLAVYARVNHAPRLLVSGKTTIEAGSACSLSFGASDPDAGQRMRYSIDNKPDAALFDTINNFFKWTPGLADTGVRSFMFRVIDNGFPPMADSLNYDITITPGTGNSAPVWLHDTIIENIQPGAVFTKTLSALCTDPEGETLLFTLLGGAPMLDTIIAGTYVFTPQTKDTGIVFLKIVATDPSGASDTVVLRLNIKYDSTATDNMPPIMRLISPSKDTVIAVDSCKIQLMCKDAGGVGSVVGLIGQTNFTGQKTAGSDSLWLLAVRGLSGGQYTTVSIIATDASAGRNKDTVSVRIKYDNDSKQPNIVLLDPQKDSTSISANSYTIKVRCIDASGIAALGCTMGTTSFPTTNGGDSIWSVNVTGLLQNQLNKITLIAIDSALKANKDTLSLYIKYDPTLDDNVKPTITILSTLPSSMIVTDSVLSITDSIYDASGIDSVYWTLNGKNRHIMASLTGGKYMLVDTLRQYHYDTIDVYAVDKSTAKNRSTQRIILNYNVPPVAKDTSVSTLLNAAKTIILSATSKDGDVLTWTVLGDPAHGSVGITGTTGTYTPATDWVGADSFYAKVTDGIWSDTAKVKVTTTDTRIAPKNVAIVIQPTSGIIMVGQPLSMSVTMNADVTPAPAYQWFRNNVAVGTASTIGISAAALTDSGTYRVTVTNGAGSASGSAVTVTVLPTYTLTVNRTATGGSVTLLKDTAVYPAGASVRLTATPATGYRFVNWTGDTTATTNPLTIIMRKDQSVVANYKRQYTLTLTSSDPAKGAVSSTAGTSPFAVDSGTAVNITATPASGYKLKQWSSTAPGIVFSSTSAISATVTLNQANATVLGSFGCMTFKKQISLGQYTNVKIYDAVQTSDDGYLVIGGTGDYPNEYALLIRLNQQGDTMWTKVDNSLVQPMSIRKVSAGFLVSGSYYSSAMVYCYAQNGNVIWSYLDGNSGSGCATVSTATKDNGYIIGGGMDGNYFLMIKTNSTRTVLWDTAYYVYAGAVNDCIPTRDEGYVFVGTGTGGLGPIAVKTSSTDSIQWALNYSSTPSIGPSHFSSVDTTNDGGCIIAGSGNQNGQAVGFILKVSSTGTFSTSGAVPIPDASKCQSIRALSNGDYLIAGGTLTAGSGGGEDIYIAHINSTGTVLHSSTYGSTGDQSANSLQLTTDGGAIVTGSGNWIIKTDENGGTD